MPFPDKQAYDDVVWEINESKWDETELRFRHKENHHKIGLLMQQALGKAGTIRRGVRCGAFNMLYQMSLEDGSSDVLLRIPCTGIIQFPNEKLLAEIATMRFIAKHTAIPVPPVLYYGTADENPTGLGPFMIIGYIKHRESLSERLAALNKENDWDPDLLDPTAPDYELEDTYTQMARHLLELSKLEFPRIGSLMPVGDWRGPSDVTGRPLPVNLNRLRQLANAPLSVLPSEGSTYRTANEWYLALADMHMAQLVFQRNDLVRSPDDGRNKYVARVLFRRLAKEGKLSTFGFADDNWSMQALRTNGSGPGSVNPLAQAPDPSGPFCLWCDDLRAGNILVGEYIRILGIIDWEFAYVGPAQFALDPPWWLLLAEPEKWPGGLEAWAAAYERCLQIWIRCLEGVEKDARPRDVEGVQVRVSLASQHRQSWEQGRFWLNYAARNSWVFDAVYWKFLDRRFFGAADPSLRASREDDLWKTRVGLLTEEEREGMETLVAIKMEEAEARSIVDWDPEEAKQHLSRFLY